MVHELSRSSISAVVPNSIDPSEVAAIAHANAGIGIGWTSDGCTDLVWGITNLAGAPFFDTVSPPAGAARLTNGDPFAPQDIGYPVPHQTGQANGPNAVGDGWEIQSHTNTGQGIIDVLRAGDVVRCYLDADEPLNTIRAHEFIVTRHDASGVWIVDNTGSAQGGFAASIREYQITSSFSWFALPSHVYVSSLTWTTVQLADDIEGTPATTQSLTPNGPSALGVIDRNGDADWFGVQLVQGTTYTIKIEGSATGQGTLADPYLRVYDNNSRFLDGNDDVSTSNFNSEKSFTAGYTGTFYLSARESGDNATGNYHISIAGQPPSDDYAANAATTGVVTPGGGQVAGNIETPADRDWFQVQVIQGSTYAINLESGSPPQVGPFLGDPEVYLYNSSGQFVDSNDDFGGLNSRLTFTASYTGAYFIGAGEHGDNATGTYRLSVSAGSAPEIAVSGNSTNIADGDTTPSGTDLTDFGNATQGGASIVHTFTVSNTGTGTLTTSGLVLPSGFSLVEGLSASISAGASDTFQVQLDTGSTGLQSGQVSFTNNDSDENPFNFQITGTVTPADDYAANTATTGVVTPGGGQVAGNIETPADRDWFQVQVIQGSTYTINLESGSPPQVGPFLGDPEVYLYDSSGQFLDSNDDFVGLNSQLTFTAAYTGAYIIGAGEHGDNATGTYRLSVSPGSEPPVLGISAISTSKVEGSDGGLTSFTFKVTRTGDTSGASSVTWTFFNGQDPTADLNDFKEPVSGTLNWDAGDASAKFITMSVKADADFELTEYFNVGLAGAVGAQIGTVSAAGTILSDDILGDDTDNSLFGTYGADQILGLGGNDLLIGGGGTDTISGGAGNDRIRGGLGNDTLDGGADTDNAYYTDKTASVGVTLNGATAASVNVGGIVEDFLRNFENINGGSAGDTLTGDGLANKLFGNNGDDTLSGGDAADTLNGGIGADQLRGDAGADDLTGGADNDIFIYTALSDSLPTARDKIRGFVSGDQLDFRAIDANAGVIGDQAFLDDNGSFSAGEIRQTLAHGNLRLDFNVDADLTPEMSVVLVWRTTFIGAGDFLG